MKRATSFLAVVFAMASCHSPLIIVERSSSGAVERPFDFWATPGADKHFISLPAYPFVNCLDVLKMQSPDLSKRSIQATPCSDSLESAGFTGYTDPHVTWATTSHEDQQRVLDEQILGVFDNTNVGHWPDPLLSFMHFSDVQIREPDAKLGGSGVSRRLDKLIQSFERDYDQEQYSLFVYAAIVKTVNSELCLFGIGDGCKISDDPSRIPPSFMVHTGDSVDAGLQSEFDSFVSISNGLNIPWYQVVGNHDVLAFGNLRLTSWDGEIPKGEDACLSPGWKGIACTCTRVAALIREYNIPHPDNKGESTKDVPSKPMTLIPILLKRICIAHVVAGDRFVMDPKRKLNASGVGNSVNSFIAAHCNGGDLRNCKRQLEKLEDNRTGDATSNENKHEIAERYAVNPNQVEDAPYQCAVLQKPVAAAPSIRGAQSVMHGFDLAPGFRTRFKSVDPIQQKAGPVDQTPTVQLDTTKLLTDKRARAGYYCFEVEMPKEAQGNRRAWAVVLNTATDTGAYGMLSRSQGDWLEDLLMVPGEESPDFAWRLQKKQATRLNLDVANRQIQPTDLVMVFAHHPAYGIYERSERERLQYILTHSRNVIGYFAGHTHDSELRVIHPTVDLPSSRPVTYRGAAPHPVWEIIGPSVIGYPQQARQVVIKTVGHLGYFEVFSFSPTGTGDSAEKVRLAQAGAMRDKCQENEKGCENGRPRLPGRAVTFPRLWFRLPCAPADNHLAACPAE